MRYVYLGERVMLITIGVVFAVGAFITASEKARARSMRELRTHLLWAAVWTALAAVGFVGWV